MPSRPHLESALSQQYIHEAGRPDGCAILDVGITRIAMTSRIESQGHDELLTVNEDRAHDIFAPLWLRESIPVT